ncbi:dUTP diphosphatase [Euzebya sp.]|uniref:dUTP diphosphatase n=1 Tax=Euzebya sp. TaxID=1971409 RepID=UPI003515F56A
MTKDLTGGTTPARADVAPAETGGGVRVPVRRLDPDLPLPRYARPGDAGLDLHARERRVLPPGTRALMPTGIAVAIPEGHVGLIHPRSGTAVRQGLGIVNSPGTVDAGYRGELLVPLINLDPSATIRLERGDRIAQLLIQRVEHALLVEVDALPAGVRGEGGFGSTGR